VSCEPVGRTISEDFRQVRSVDLVDDYHVLGRWRERADAADDIAAAEARVSDELPSDPAAVSQLARDVTDILGLSTISPSRGKRCAPLTRPSKVFTMQPCWWSARRPLFTASLVNELRELEDATSGTRPSRAGWPERRCAITSRPASGRPPRPGRE
jgi:hypothetical protein